jgi:hypothetical protein
MRIFLKAGIVTDARELDPYSGFKSMRIRNADFSPENILPCIHQLVGRETQLPVHPIITKAQFSFIPQ